MTSSAARRAAAARIEPRALFCVHACSRLSGGVAFCSDTLARRCLSALFAFQASLRRP